MTCETKEKAYTVTLGSHEKTLSGPRRNARRSPNSIPPPRSSGGSMASPMIPSRARLRPGGSCASGRPTASRARCSPRPPCGSRPPAASSSTCARWNDDDHVLAVFRHNGAWGCIAKSNFTVLRFRDPVYRSIRELMMSYFDVYFNSDRPEDPARVFRAVRPLPLRRRRLDDDRRGRERHRRRPGPGPALPGPDPGPDPRPADRATPTWSRPA